MGSRRCTMPFNRKYTSIKTCDISSFFIFGPHTKTKPPNNSSGWRLITTKDIVSFIRNIHDPPTARLDFRSIKNVFRGNHTPQQQYAVAFVIIFKPARNCNVFYFPKIDLYNTGRIINKTFHPKLDNIIFLYYNSREIRIKTGGYECQKILNKRRCWRPALCY